MAEVEKTTDIDKEPSTAERQIIAFKLGDEIFGLDITNIERIAQLESFTLVPDSSCNFQ